MEEEDPDDTDLLDRFGISDDFLHFPEYLRFMRMAHDRNACAIYERQNEAAEENGFTPTEVMEARKIFRLCDQDKSSLVDFSELGELFTKILKVPPEVAKKTLKQMEACDDNGDGNLDFSEFLALMRTMMDEFEA